MSLRLAVLPLLAIVNVLGAQIQPSQHPCTVPRLPPSSITFGPGGSADEIRGRVISHHTLEVVPGARITLPSLRLEVKADTLGAFRIAGITHGDYEIVVHGPGPSIARSLVTFEGPTHVVVVLALQAIADFACVRPAPSARPPNEELKPMAPVEAPGSLRSPAASYWMRHGLTPAR